jgi:hypothetical protein
MVAEIQEPVTNKLLPRTCLSDLLPLARAHLLEFPEPSKCSIHKLVGDFIFKP